MARPQKDTVALNIRLDATKRDRLTQLLLKWGYRYREPARPLPLWGEFLDKIPDAIIADDGENVVIKIPYRNA